MKPAPTEALRAHVRQFVHRFGLLHDAETPCGLPLQPTHAHALSALLERQEGALATRHKDLAAALGLDKSSVARLCQRMEDAGHLTQTRVADDGRARELALTAKGARLAREVDEASRARFARVLAAIPRGQRAQVLDALAVLNAAVETLRENEEPSR